MQHSTHHTHLHDVDIDMHATNADDTSSMDFMDTANNLEST